METGIDSFAAAYDAAGLARESAKRMNEPVELRLLSRLPERDVVVENGLGLIPKPSIRVRRAKTIAGQRNLLPI